MKGTKKFACFWGEGYIRPSVEASYKKHKETWFTPERGYTDEHIEAISRLEIGECYGPYDLNAYHSIVRVK